MNSYLRREKKGKDFSRKTSIFVAHISRNIKYILEYMRNPENTKIAKILFLAIYRKKRYGPDFPSLSRPYPRCTTLCPIHVSAAAKTRGKHVRTKFPSGVINRHLCEAEYLSVIHACLVFSLLSESSFFSTLMYIGADHLCAVSLHEPCHALI